MRLAPGAPLAVSLAFDEAGPRDPVGRLAMANGQAQLEWDPAALGRGCRISPLHYPLEPGLHPARGRDFEGLHGFLADSLPEGWGHLLMRRRLARLGVRIETLSPLDRLGLVGREGRGALVFEPATTPPAEADGLDLDALAAESRALLDGEAGALADLLARLGGGSGGARPKVHVGLAPDGRFSVGEGEVRADQEAWIVKFRAPSDPEDIGPIEGAYALMAAAAGLAMSPHRLFPAKHGAAYFGARRFDRPAPGGRLHMVSLAGAVEARPDPGTLGYDGFLRAVSAITRHAGDVEDAFRRMVFNILTCNRDDHTRQQSFLMDPSGVWRLAPAYDLTWSTGPGGEHYMDVEGEGRSPTRAHVGRLGLRHGISSARIDEIVATVRDAVASWSAFAATSGVGRSSAYAVSEAIAAVGRDFAVT